MRGAIGEPERTPDGHYVIVGGRRWRATDPEIPHDAATVLRRELMSARRSVGAALKVGDRGAERTARDRVQQAKTALGERGTPWWQQTTTQRQLRWTDLVGALRDQSNPDDHIIRPRNKGTGPRQQSDSANCRPAAPTEA